MTITQGLARSLMAPIFITGGVDAIRNPSEKAKTAAPIVARLASSFGMADDAVRFVRINGAVQIAAGSLLALGRLPRLSSAALAVSLLPTTLAGHRYWEENDPAQRALQRTQLLKNLSMLGGLLFAATDTGGAPSLAWRAARRARQTQDRAARMSVQAAAAIHGPHRNGSTLAELGERAMTIASALGERASHVGERAARVAASGTEVVGHATDAGIEHLADAAHHASIAGRHAGHLVAELADHVRSGASHLGDRAAHVLS